MVSGRELDKVQLPLMVTLERMGPLLFSGLAPEMSFDEWIARRPWEAIRAAMRETLADLSWTELFFGTAFLASGRLASGELD
jgi:hypothetical protein